MKSNAIRWVLLVIGILLVAMGVALLFTPAENSIVLAYCMSALMLVYGIAEIVYYIVKHDQDIAGWILADGLITGILGALLLITLDATVLTMTLLFTMWVLFTGVVRLVAGFAAKEAGSSGWGWVLAAGIAGIVIGIWFMFDPLLAFFSVGYLLPLVFVVQGISAIAVFFSTSGNNSSSFDRKVSP